MTTENQRRDLIPVSAEFHPDDNRSDVQTEINEKNKHRFTDPAVHEIAAALQKLRLPVRVQLRVNYEPTNPALIRVEYATLNGTKTMVGSDFSLFNLIKNMKPDSEELEAELDRQIRGALKHHLYLNNKELEDVSARNFALAKIVHALR